MKMNKEEERFRQKFKAFPSVFNLEINDLDHRRNKQLYKRFQQKIQSDEFFETATEKIRIFDLISFLAWCAHDKEVAYTYNNKALELDKENIVSLSNRLWMWREDGYLTEANEELIKLDKLAKSNNNLLLIGNAEMAYFYSAYGPSYLLKSIDVLEEVLCNRDISKVDLFTSTLWKFDLGTTYRKLCNAGNTPTKGWQGRNEDKCIKRGAQLLYEVVCSDCSGRWRGRCWASLAELLNDISMGVKVNKYRKEELFPKDIEEYSVESLIDLATETCCEDSNVLKICGKLYKYLRKLDKAEEMLRKSLKKRKTSYAHHHLALVLKLKLKNRLFNNRRSNGYDPINTYTRHKSFIANDVAKYTKSRKIPSQSTTKGYNKYSQERTKTNIKLTFSREEKSVSATLQTMENVPSLNKAVDSNVQNTETRKITRAVAKGFDRVFSIPNNETKAVHEILYHLDEAIGFGNAWASLDKGIILRQIKEHKEAIDVFLNTLKMTVNITATIEISCYENLGSCCRDIAEQEADLLQKRKRETNAVIYWRKALETIASKEDKTLHFPKEEWMSYPLLKDMFQHRKHDIEMLKELKELGEILERPAEIRSYCQQIYTFGEEEANDPAIICSEIKTFLIENRYGEAYQLLEKRQKDGIIFDKLFCKLIYLESALYYASTGNTESSRKSCRQAFETDKDTSTAKLSFDIFFLYDEEAEENRSIYILSQKLEKYLIENFGLRITSNSRNVDPGTYRMKCPTQNMECSKYIVLLLDTNEKPSGDFEYFITIAQDISKKNKLILNLILIDGCSSPTELAVFPIMHFKTKQLQYEIDFIKWIRIFIFHLLRVDENEE